MPNREKPDPPAFGYGKSIHLPPCYVDLTDVRKTLGSDYRVTAEVQHGSLTEVVARRGRKVEWCRNCRAGDHGKCNGRRIKKYERGYAPCECAAHGHGRKGEQPRT